MATPEAHQENGRKIAGWEDLYPSEQNRVASIIIKTKQTIEENYNDVTGTARKKWVAAALEYWDSQNIPELAPLKPLTIALSCSIIGHFTRDLPAGSSQLETAGTSAAETYTSIPNTPRVTRAAKGSSKLQTQGVARNIPSTPQKFKSRKAGAPAYVRPGIQRFTGAITYDFLCAQGRRASAEFIRKNGDTLSPMDCIVAIRKWDNAEFRRLRRWNADVAIYLIQHYIFGLTHHTNTPPLATTDNFFTICLIGDALDQWKEQVANIDNDIARGSQKRTFPDPNAGE